MTTRAEVDPQPGSRRSARSAARTNGLDARPSMGHPQLARFGKLAGLCLDNDRALNGFDRDDWPDRVEVDTQPHATLKSYRPEFLAVLELQIKIHCPRPPPCGILHRRQGEVWISTCREGPPIR